MTRKMRLRSKAKPSKSRLHGSGCELPSNSEYFIWNRFRKLRKIATQKMSRKSSPLEFTFIFDSTINVLFSGLIVDQEIKLLDIEVLDKN